MIPGFGPSITCGLLKWVAEGFDLQKSQMVSEKLSLTILESDLTQALFTTKHHADHPRRKASSSLNTHLALSRPRLKAISLLFLCPHSVARPTFNDEQTPLHLAKPLKEAIIVYEEWVRQFVVIPPLPNLDALSLPGYHQICLL